MLRAACTQPRGRHAWRAEAGRHAQRDGHAPGGILSKVAERGMTSVLPPLLWSSDCEAEEVREGRGCSSRRE